MTSLAARIKALRQARRLSQPELARLVGVSQSAISQIERGTTKALKGAVLAAMCKHLHVTPQFLVGDTSASSEHSDDSLETEAMFLFRGLDYARQRDALLMLRGLASAAPRIERAGTPPQPKRLDKSRI